MTLIFVRSMYNKTIIRFGFYDIKNKRGLGKGYQPQRSASVDNPYLDLDYSGYHKKPHPIIVYNLSAIDNGPQQTQLVRDHNPLS